MAGGCAAVLAAGLVASAADAGFPRRTASTRCASAPGGGLTLTNVAARGSRVVAPGSNGLVATSRGPRRWSVVRPAPIGHNLRGVVWTGSRWVAVGDGGTIVSSEDLRTWTQAAGIPNSGLRGLAARPGLVVAGGSDGTVVSSPDGQTWTVRQSGTSNALWGGTRVGASVLLSGANATVMASTDGATWRPVPTSLKRGAPRSALLWQLATNGRRLVAVGGFGAVLEGSLRGLTAVSSPARTILRGVTFGRGAAVAVGESGAILRSSGPRRWQLVRAPITVDLRGVAYTGSRFVAVGDESTVISSSDGQRWRVDATAMPCALLSVARGAGRFVAVGGAGHVKVSSDGRRWRDLPPPTSEDLYGIVHGPRGFIAVGAKGTVLQSRDGRHWVERRVATRLNLHAATWTGRQYLVGGDSGRLFSSSDGVHWRLAPFFPPYSIRDFATAGTTSIAAGAGLIARRAGNGAWQLESIGIERFQTSVAAGAGRFVVVGHNGEALVSTDGGRTWTAGNTGVEINLDRVVYTGERFLATGQGSSLISADGLTWSPLRIPTRRSIRSIAVRGSLMVAVGDLGVILRSTDSGQGWRRVR
jgi:photosystem II stability/assembly factor-like uncharacterized protein